MLSLKKKKKKKGCTYLKIILLSLSLPLLFFNITSTVSSSRIFTRGNFVHGSTFDVKYRSEDTKYLQFNFLHSKFHVLRDVQKSLDKRKQSVEISQIP